MPCYGGDHEISVELEVHRNSPGGRKALTFQFVYQLCTIHGCSVPRRDSLRLFLDVAPAPPPDNRDLAPS
jgi:hypothetical protein